VGLGAVGGYALEALARAGVGHLRLIDFDLVTESNLNRQLLALHSTIGRSKVELAAERVRDIHPACDVRAISCFVNAETLDTVFDEPIDLLIDAIDSLNPKVELLAAAVARQTPVLSSMGAALRTDPHAVHVASLSHTRSCPLARLVRKRLRRRGVSTEFRCVYSSELVGDPTRQFDDGVEELSENLHPQGRVRRVLGSLPTLTGIFGLTLANEALRMLLAEHFPGGRR
jgi:tRNA A37 threonylcarbamoyladenosine dehydratase